MNYIITQCYPNGDEYVVSTIERRQLPLYVKVLCMNLGDELIEAQTQTGGMAVDEHGIRMTIVGFTLLLDSQQSENEILDSFGKETVNKYRNRNW
jgi:hypothetical protein